MNNFEDPNYNSKQLRVYIGIALPMNTEDVTNIFPSTLKNQHIPLPLIHGISVKLINPGIILVPSQDVQFAIIFSTY